MCENMEVYKMDMIGFIGMGNMGMAMLKGAKEHLMVPRLYFIENQWIK